ncbi:hypothetical protein GCM10012288_12950 [Malaciobacter pacificus]|uniref:MCP four helix bundle domain-containing protein n=1 Tax=Malaciobacter pacificus TaxID=1080223 RepID=UPI00102987C3|nr:MCP four helix bundle domain-containing protein [Malaciobacter pacificus]GGD40286.1 hypothetical protein GCM10012288_12950 [Malaciobacter pacificus]
MSLRNKIIISFAILIVIVSISSIYVSNNISNIKVNVDKLTHEQYQGITVLLEADRDSYQSNVAISQIMHLNDKEEIDKLIKKGVLDNLT